MANHGSEVSVSGITEDFPETTVEIKIKTLDSQTYTLRVNRCMPVPALKEQIANVTGILSEQQRLICQGKVLKDDQLLSAYHVENGHTLHLVVRQPPSVAATVSLGTEGASNQSGTNPTLRSVHDSNYPSGDNVVFGTVNIADQGDHATSEFSRVVSTLISSFGLAGFGAGNERLDSRHEQDHDRPPRASASGASVVAETDASQSSARAEVYQHQGAARPLNMHSLGQQHPTVIPDALTTLFHFLSHMRCEFDVNGREHENSGEVANTHNHGGGGDSSFSHLEQGLPTPARLAEILLSARQLLTEQAAGSLYELATHLEGQADLTDPLTRTSIQSNAVRSGVLFQHLGSLLLELGRTLVTLRMGQTPSEAVVNAGPAIFISSTSPNPLMVQAGTSFGGIPIGSLHPGHGQSGHSGSGLLSGNIDIRIHRGPSVATVASNGGNQASGQQLTGSDISRSSSENLPRQAFRGLTVNASIPRESGVRMLPLRTVVAVPGGVGRPSSDSSGNALGIFYPLLARFQQRSGNAGSLNERTSQASPGQHSAGSGTIGHQTHESATGGNVIEPSGLGSAHQVSSGISTPSMQGAVDRNSVNVQLQADDGRQSSRDSVAQMFSTFGDVVRDIFQSEETETSGSAQGMPVDTVAGQVDTMMHAGEQFATDGQFFSALVRQLMPFISQNVTQASHSSSDGIGSSSGHYVNHSSIGSTSSLNRRDPPEAPESKRPKRE